MSDYFITQIAASDKRGNRLVDELLTSEGIRRDGNLDYTCGMYDDEMNLIATGSCFGNTLRCMAVSHEHQGEGLMNSIVSHLIELQFSRGNTHLFLYAILPDFSAILAFMRLHGSMDRLSLWKISVPVFPVI